MAVTKLPSVSQWAAMHRMALGRGIRAAVSRQAAAKEVSATAFIGLPCPTKRTGIREESGPAAFIIESPWITSVLRWRRCELHYPKLTSRPPPCQVPSPAKTVFQPDGSWYHSQLWSAALQDAAVRFPSWR